MKPYQIIIIVAVVILLGVIVLPLFNRQQFRRLPYDQQILAIMKQANKLVFWKIFPTVGLEAFSLLKTSAKFLFIPG